MLLVLLPKGRPVGESGGEESSPSQRSGDEDELMTGFECRRRLCSSSSHKLAGDQMPFDLP